MNIQHVSGVENPAAMLTKPDAERALRRCLAMLPQCERVAAQSATTCDSQSAMASDSPSEDCSQQLAHEA